MAPPPWPRLLLASTNRHKLGELQASLAGLPLTVVTPDDAGLRLEVEETGNTFRDNAVLKAEAFARAAGLATLADDSGLEVDALDGAPGVRSARYAGPGASDADRIALLLTRLEGVPEARRAARFRCVIALATPTALIGTVEGACAGVITDAPRGSGGFGYDPVFLLPELGRTMAELTAAEKQAISHRGRAVRAARSLIQEWQRLAAASPLPAP